MGATTQDQTELIDRTVMLVQRQMLADQFWPKLKLKKAPPHQQAVFDAWLNGAMYILLRWGRRSSKTVTGAKLFIPELGFKPPGSLPQRVLSHTGPNWEVTDRVFSYLKKWIKDDRIFGVEPRVIDGNRIIELPWGARTEGETTHRDSGEPDNLLGEGIVGRIGDEHARDKANVLDKYLMPPLFDTGGWIILISTPRGKLNHLYETEMLWKARMEAGDHRYFVSHATSYDNPYINHKALDEYRIKCEQTGSMDLFREQILAEYTSRSGSIYPQFRYEQNGKPWHVGHYPYIPGVPVDFGIDWGYDHPFVCLFGQVIDGDRLRIFAEISQRGLSPVDQCNRVMSKLDNIAAFEPDAESIYDIMGMVYADPSGAASKKLFRDAGFSVWEPSKRDRTRINSVNDGIVEVRKLLSRPDITGLEIDKSCVNLIKGIQNYVWSDKAQLERPVKIDDDECDALRYYVMGAIGLHTGAPVFIDLN